MSFLQYMIHHVKHAEGRTANPQQSKWSNRSLQHSGHKSHTKVKQEAEGSKREDTGISKSLFKASNFPHI